MVPMLLAIILNDYVFEKYGYEEEDFMKKKNKWLKKIKEWIDENVPG